MRDRRPRIVTAPPRCSRRAQAQPEAHMAGALQGGTVRDRYADASPGATRAAACAQRELMASNAAGDSVRM